MSASPEAMEKALRLAGCSCAFDIATAMDALAAERVAAEREACARVADYKGRGGTRGDPCPSLRRRIAKEIRARKNAR